MVVAVYFQVIILLYSIVVLGARRQQGHLFTQLGEERQTTVTENANNTDSKCLSYRPLLADATSAARKIFIDMEIQVVLQSTSVAMILLLL